jgi:hypothetical protein
VRENRAQSLARARDGSAQVNLASLIFQLVASRQK